jgi:hypothetical protein
MFFDRARGGFFVLLIVFLAATSHTAKLFLPPADPQEYNPTGIPCFKPRVGWPKFAQSLDPQTACMSRNWTSLPPSLPRFRILERTGRRSRCQSKQARRARDFHAVRPDRPCIRPPTAGAAIGSCRYKRWIEQRARTIVLLVPMIIVCPWYCWWMTS